MDIRIRYECKDCKGTGVTTLSVWDEFHKLGVSKWPHEKVLEWLESHGASIFDDLGPEEVLCDSCCGTGFCYGWLNLQDNLSIEWD